MNFRRWFVFNVLVLVCFVLNAETFRVDNLDYTILSESPAEVGVSRGLNHTTDIYDPAVTFVIPSSVKYYGKTYSVVAVQRNGFYEQKDLVEITLPETIRTIGHNAFQRCSRLNTATVQEGLVTIEDNAFDCSGLEHFTFPSTLRILGKNAFSQTKITDATVNMCTEIGESCFSFCQQLNSAWVDGATMGIGVFAGCTNLYSPRLDNLTEIPAYTFDGCTNYRWITFEDSPNVKKIGSMAFRNCGEIQHFDLPMVLEEIGDAAFENTILNNFTIPASVQIIGDQAFAECFDYFKTIREGTHVVLEDSDQPLMVVMSTMDDSKTLSGNIFGTHGMRSIYLGRNVNNGITGNALFGSHTHNQGIIYCPGLKEITIGNKVTELSKGIFSQTFLVEGIVLPDGLKIIGDEAFKDCSALKSISIPGSVEQLGNWAFQGCESMTSIRFEDSALPLNMAGNSQGLRTTAIDDIYIGRNFTGTNISSCFGGTLAPKYSSLTIDGYASKVDDNMFSDVNTLGYVVIGKNVKIIGDGAFSNCCNLREVVFQGDDMSLGSYAFRGCSSLFLMNLPVNTTSIPDQCFSGCAFTSFVVPDNVTSIGNNAFYSCGKLESVVIGKNVESIGSMAFYNSTALLNVTSRNPNPPMCAEYGLSFYGVPLEDCALFVPKKGMVRYKEAEQWKEFGFIDVFDPEASLEVESITLEPSELDIPAYPFAFSVGSYVSSGYIHATLSPSEDSTYDMTELNWSVYPSDIITITPQDGLKASIKYTTCGFGEATIRAEAHNGVFGECQIVVTPDWQDVNELRFRGKPNGEIVYREIDAISIKPGENYDFIVSPDGNSIAGNLTISSACDFWAEPSGIIQIDKSKASYPQIVAVNYGECQLYANCYDKTISIPVTVTEDSGIENVGLDSEISFERIPGGIIIKSQHSIQVIALSGIVVYQGPAGEISLAPGIYLVNVNGKTLKLVL